MKRAASLVEELARPVVRQHLTRLEAEAALACRILRTDRLGLEDGEGTVDEKLAIQCHLLDLQISSFERQREATAHDIGRIVWPLIDRRQPRNQIRAEAHDVNAAHDFPFNEPEVEDVLISLLLRAQARARARRANGR